MKIDGNKRISICYEDEFGKITIENYQFKEIVSYIAAQSFVDIQLENDNYKRKITRYIIIDGEKYNLKTDIRMKFEISFLSIPIVCSGYFIQKYDTEIETEIKELYNYIVETVEYYACELNTDINNIRIEAKELEILNVYEKKGEQ